jgi:hypothetical protein
VNELLGQPEYLHVLVNPLLTHALPFAAMGLLLALFGGSRGGIRIALILVLLSAAAVWPTLHYGRHGFDRVKAMTDETGGDWLMVHRHRAEQGAWVFYAAAAAALAALLVPLKWAKSLKPLAVLTLMLAAGACLMAAQIAYPAGKIRHREFRHEAPPEAELQAAVAKTEER